VGHKPEAVPLVERTDISSSQHCPSAVIPESGQVTEDDSEPPSNESWAVLHEDEAGSNLANDARHFRPEAGTLTTDAGPFARNADVLAWEAARNHVNTSAPRVSVKGPNVIPNREGREKSVVLPGGKNACCVGFSLDGADRSPSEELAAEYASTSAREKSQLIHTSPC
jgi:hypothetical protein